MTEKDNRPQGVIYRLAHMLRHIAFIVRSWAGRMSEDMSRQKALSVQDELYSSRKAAQIVAYFALRQGGRVIEVLKAIKLVYLADRESIRRCGAPLLHEPRLSLKLGPVNQTTMEYVNGDRTDEDGWSRFVSAREENANDVRIAPGITMADLDDFNQAELRLLDDIWAQHGRFASFQIANWTHRPGNVPEWRDPRRRTPAD